MLAKTQFAGNPLILRIVVSMLLFRGRASPRPLLRQARESSESYIGQGISQMLWAATHDGVFVRHLVGFAANEYKSAGIDKEILKDFIESGGHPFGMFDGEVDTRAEADEGRKSN